MPTREISRRGSAEGGDEASLAATAKGVSAVPAMGKTIFCQQHSISFFLSFFLLVTEVVLLLLGKKRGTGAFSVFFG